ncbi:MAG: DUF547 domain-containing protein [Candidatus Omnitrophica bacterium]|nr:DUF547 domain-containing protein [Candidatus Omnitrophota bacterium]
MTASPSRLLVGTLLGLTLGALSACATSEATGSFDHSAWDRLLNDTIRDGVVDYAALSKRYSELQGFLDALAKAPFESLPREEKLATGINAYNAQCIAGVLKQGKIKSVRDVWMFFKRTRFVLGGKELSLDNLEHDILRKMGEPRIHFALVCASKSCPKLASKAYTASTLEEDLAARTREFLSDKTRNYLDRERRVLHLSSLFKWFKSDFQANAASVLDFVKPYLPEADRRFLEAEKVKINFLDYDWSLNGTF